MSTAHTHMDGRTLAIGVLTITACVLFVGFLLVTTLSTPAHATGMNDRSGDYIILTQQLTRSDEGVVIIDAATKRLLVYGYDFSRKQLQRMSGFSLDQLQTPAPGEGRPAQPGARRGP